MKLYEMAVAPNPRRVRMFMAEKGVLEEAERIELNLGKGEHRTTDFAAKNPFYRVPVLELDDGHCISETTAICRYIEESHPGTPNLLGQDALEKATIEQWIRWVDFEFMVPLGSCFQHCSGYFKDHMKTFPDFGAECGKKTRKFLEFLNEHLKNNDYICCNRFTIADINAYVTLQFAKVVDIRILEEQTYLKEWHDRIDARSSAKV